MLTFGCGRLCTQHKRLAGSASGKYSKEEEEKSITFAIKVLLVLLCRSSISMAVSKFLLLFTILGILFSAIATTESSESTVDVELLGDSDNSLQVEHNQLKSKLSQLESKIEEKAQELTTKENTIEELEQIIVEKSNSLASLQSQTKSLEEKVSVNTKEQEGGDQEIASQLLEQISSLKKQIEAQNKKKVDLEARANSAEMKINDLNLKLENLRRTKDEQKSRIRKTQRTLEIAEEELMKAKLEASTVSKQLKEVQKAWIPRWLAIHFYQCQYFVTTNWNKHGRPALDLTIKKAADKITVLENWAKPHFDELNSKWIPFIKEQALAFWKSVTYTATDKYQVFINVVNPYYMKVKVITDPHIKEAKKILKPYADQISAVSKPHLQKASVYMKPYTKKVIRNYKSISRKWSSYHRQLQANIIGVLKSHEYTKPFATKVIAWYTALALMSVPVLFVLNVVSSIFSEKPKRRKRSSHTKQTRRKSKRVHSES